MKQTTIKHVTKHAHTQRIIGEYLALAKHISPPRVEIERIRAGAERMITSGVATEDEVIGMLRIAFSDQWLVSRGLTTAWYMFGSMRERLLFRLRAGKNTESSRADSALRALMEEGT